MGGILYTRCYDFVINKTSICVIQFSNSIDLTLLHVKYNAQFAVYSFHLFSLSILFIHTKKKYCDQESTQTKFLLLSSMFLRCAQTNLINH